MMTQVIKPRQKLTNQQAVLLSKLGASPVANLVYELDLVQGIGIEDVVYIIPKGKVDGELDAEFVMLSELSPASMQMALRSNKQVVKALRDMYPEVDKAADGMLTSITEVLRADDFNIASLLPMLAPLMSSNNKDDQDNESVVTLKLAEVKLIPGEASAMMSPALEAKLKQMTDRVAREGSSVIVNAKPTMVSLLKTKVMENPVLLGQLMGKLGGQGKSAQGGSPATTF